MKTKPRRVNAQGVDTRQKVPCAKCGNKFPRRFDHTEYCFKCERLENKLERMTNKHTKMETT